MNLTTEDILAALKLTAKLMELHGENPFKVRSLNISIFNIDKAGENLSGLNYESLLKVEGVGKGIAERIVELSETGETRELRALLDKTPAGVIDMMGIKGLGPKKVGQLWKELGIESVGELYYACNENRLLGLKGFGPRTQESVKKAIEFRMASAGKFHYATALQAAQEIIEELKKQAKPGDLISFTGAIRRRSEIIEKIEVLVDEDAKIDLGDFRNSLNLETELIRAPKKDFAVKLFETSAAPAHLEKLGNDAWRNGTFGSEKEIYQSMGMAYILPELREGYEEVELARMNKLPRLIEDRDLKGILHNHTKYSDGLHTLREMAEACKKAGYQYLGICDHSRSAFYANGLQPERVVMQQKEIDELNTELAPFRIFKGIESDILFDGSLDYEDDILATFDMVVASVHSNLKMDQEKATARVLRAIENPYTTVLGHPTGRLLLSREGYPLDHKRIIDACAANGVVMELNANPYRLDIDWRWISYCIKKGVMISINPDAHDIEGYKDMFFGVCAARKGMLTKEMCFNALSLEEMERYLQNRKKK
jgi:DNA polymerase (family 10)